MGPYCERIATEGSWINTEKNWCINALELKCFLLSLMSIPKDYGIHEKSFFQIVFLPKHVLINQTHPFQNYVIFIQSESGNGKMIWIGCFWRKSLHKASKILKFYPEIDIFSSNRNYEFHTYSLSQISKIKLWNY